MIIIKGDSRERCEVLAEYMIENKATVRKTAYRYGVSKSTVHKDVTEKLKKINPALYTDVKVILDTNKAERHIRGGEATRVKYKKVHQDN
jgi:putative DeoR family transcriptional regulator (stage III sporulation protein D)